MIDSFQGEFRFLSNFWLVQVLLDGVPYRSVEHAYMAAKTLDPELREQMRSMDRPGDVKRFARTIQLREDWEDVKLDIMRDLVRQKFKTPNLKRLLLATGNQQLVEGNTWGDRFWGVCNGVGENYLGKILMDVRQSIKEK